jgi:hypothetical protein
MKAVAGSGRAKEGGRKAKVKKQRQVGRNLQAGRKWVVGREAGTEQPCRQSTEASWKRQAEAGR